MRGGGGIVREFQGDFVDLRTCCWGGDGKLLAEGSSLILSGAPYGK